MVTVNGKASQVVRIMLVLALWVVSGVFVTTRVEAGCVMFLETTGFCGYSWCKSGEVAKEQHVCKLGEQLHASVEMCKIQKFKCEKGDDCCSGFDCFSADTKVDIPGEEEQIASMEVGQQVVSYDEKEDEITTGVVNSVFEVMVDSYYKIRLKDGNELRVTGKHPLYAADNGEEQVNFWQYKVTESLTAQTISNLVK